MAFDAKFAVAKVAFHFIERRIVPSSKAQLSKIEEQSFSLGEKVARQRRMRAARPTISSVCVIVERAPLTRRYRATLSRWERGILQTHL
jgi:hypothetical protein